MKAHAVRVGLLLTSVVVALALAEAALRVLPVPIPTGVPDETLGYIHEPDISRTTEDPESGRHVLVETNPFGFRDAVWNPGAHPTVMVVGDSFVDAMQVQKQERFTEILAGELSRGGTAWRVLNTGIEGSGPETYIERVRKFVPLFAPEHVVVAIFNGNDLHNPNYDLTPASARKAYVVRDGSVVAYRDIASTWQKLEWLVKIQLGRSALIRLANDAWIKASQQTEESYVVPQYCSLSPQDLANSFLIFDTLLEQMDQLSGHRLIILDIPEKSQFSTNLPEGCSPTVIESHLASFARDRGIPYVALFDRFAGLGEAPYYAGHFAPLGHRVAAEALRQVISEIHQGSPGR